MRRTGTILAVILLLGACGQPKAPGPSREAPLASSPSQASLSPGEGQLGQLVAVEGTAEDAKLGALVIAGSGMIWIDALDAWPPNVRGKRVRVTGKLIERSDLPVFVRQQGEPEMQGIPVSPGTDLEKARRRLLLADARWKVIAPVR